MYGRATMSRRRVTLRQHLVYGDHASEIGIERDRSARAQCDGPS